MARSETCKKKAGAFMIVNIRTDIRIKAILTGCLSLLFVLTLSTGCGSSDNSEEIVKNDQPTEQPEPPTQSTDADALGPALSAEPLPVPEDNAFVRVSDYISDIVIDLKYATPDNFTGSVIYSCSDAYLRYGTVVKLAEVQKELRELDLGLKIWDAFRPVSSQFRLWEICPDAAYVANPYRGFSSHSRGNTVDLTLVDAQGIDIEMPTGFDDFTAKADRDYSDCSETAAANARLLETLMQEQDFQPYAAEWWHFSDNTAYEVDETFEPVADQDGRS